jgi:hypothetical protein
MLVPEPWDLSSTFWAMHTLNQAWSQNSSTTDAVGIRNARVPVPKFGIRGLQPCRCWLSFFISLSFLTSCDHCA